MLSTIRKVTLACLIGLFLIMFSASLVSAQETGTLIVYTETLGGDASFTYSGSPSPLANFQVTTDSGGAARIFNLTAGTYTITQNALPTNWALKEMFLDGTSTGTVNQSQAKATFTITSVADVFYLRFTNEDQTVIPEFSVQAMMLFIVVATSAVALFSIKKHKKAAAIPFTFLLLTLILIASTGTAIANPDKYIQMGTSGNDDQIQFGTLNRDVIVQLGFGGNDTQYGEGGEGNDTIIQNGGSANDDLTAIAGDQNDFVLQEAGEGNDTLYIEGGAENTIFHQYGGAGDDIMEAVHGINAAFVIYGGDGNDQIKVYSGPGFDDASIKAGSGNDSLDYYISLGQDIVRIDGDSGSDILRIHSFDYGMRLLDEQGQLMYSAGTDLITVTVVGIEHGRIFTGSSASTVTVFQW